MTSETRMIACDFSAPISNRGVFPGRLKRTYFDLLVVGGGITGAAIAREAAAQGLQVALLEKGDFASGTSSRSSRLIHGGLKYLGQGKIRLVHNSLREQQRLSEIAPHLVRPVDLLFPFCGLSLKRRVGYRAGLLAYKLMQPRTAITRHVSFTSKERRHSALLYSSDKPKGGFVCREYLTHDSRLVLETVLAAQLLGAWVINYARFIQPLVFRGRIAGGMVRDELTGREFAIRARVVVNATGPWSDGLISQTSAPRLRLTKGVHIILPRARLPISDGIIFFSARDRKPLVAIPVENYVMAGPTETEFRENPDSVSPDRDDIEYLLESLRGFFAGVALRSGDVVDAKAGLRPLCDQSARPVAGISRAYRIEWHREGLLSVLGGKLTLHRQAAHYALQAVSRKLKTTAANVSAESEMLPGARWTTSRSRIVAILASAGVPEDSIEHLVQTYGGRSALFPELLSEEPSLRDRIVPGLPHIWAELAFAIRYEMAIFPTDFLERRSDLALRAKAERAPIPKEFDRVWYELIAGREPNHGREKINERRLVAL